MTSFKQQDGLIERLYWLIRLRWIAVVGVALTILFVEKVVHLSLFSLPLFSIVVFLGIYNLIFLLFLNHLNKRKAVNPALSESESSINGRKGGVNLNLSANRLANLQISLDLLSLIGLIHFSGGLENPFIFYFIFHMIIASILLSRRASYLQATLAIVLLMLTIFFEYKRLLPHYCLKGYLPYTLHDNLLYIFGASFVFTSTLYIAVYMATSISTRLRDEQRKLKEANTLLKEQDRIKSEYVLRVTHDIKEHLAAVEACLEPVTRGITGSLNEKQLDLLTRADMRASKLMSFVKALLEITRIKLNKEIEMRTLSFKRLVENTLSFVEAKAKAKGILIGCEIAPSIDQIQGAEVYLEETLSNLLANSVRYTPSGGRVSLIAQDNGETILIKISDTGIGIPKDELPKVFDEFYRASNAKEIERDGTGLGLAMAKQVVQRHQGKIWVKSEEGRGSTFSILLPKVVASGG